MIEKGSPHVKRCPCTRRASQAGPQDLITGIMERMEGDVEKREESTGGNGREAEAERAIPGRRIIGTYGGLVG